MKQPAMKHNVPMSELTTLEVGGPARRLTECATVEEVREALAWAKGQRFGTFVLGGGSNVLVADAGFDGLVIRPIMDGLSVTDEGEHVRLRAGAGWVWDELVARTVASGWAGIECLSGIPGRVGAAPIQNIGAYGQEVAETLVAVEAVDRGTGELRVLTAPELAFGYRDSRFKRDWRDRFVIVSVDFRLAKQDRGTVLYPGLRSQLGLEADSPAPDLKTTREAVLEVRRQKSMVWDVDDPNRRSAGSFFVNPIVPDADADAAEAAARRLGVGRDMPRFPVAGRPGEVKLSAAWLIEEAGFKRGHKHGRAGLSSRHTLALINRGGAESRELLDLAHAIQDRVFEAFGVRLHPEPVLLGF